MRILLTRKMLPLGSGPLPVPLLLKKKKKSRQTKSNDLAGVWLCSTSAGDASFSSVAVLSHTPLAQLRLCPEVAVICSACVLTMAPALLSMSGRTWGGP